METGKKHLLNGLTGKLFGGLDMGWKNVVLFAAGTALLTAFFLIVPVFEDTSFEMMGVTFDAWILFAVLIMANCKTPLESALKTFVFFLISQPLIYLLQVPFSDQGWWIFHYYYNWILWTLLTFPMAFAGWFIRKRNWLSVLIFAPVFAFLGVMAWGYASEAVKVFPRYLIAALFCLGQIVLYILAFFPDVKQKLAGGVIPIVAAIAVTVLSAATPQDDFLFLKVLPDAPPLSEDAEIMIDDRSIGISFQDLEEDVIAIRARAYATATITVTDGGETYRYALEIYNEDGSAQARLTPVGRDGQ